MSVVLSSRLLKKEAKQLKSSSKIPTQQQVANVEKVTALLTTNQMEESCAIKVMCCMNGSVTNVITSILERQAETATPEPKNML